MARTNVVFPNHASTVVCNPSCAVAISNVVFCNGNNGIPFYVYFDSPVEVTGIRGRRLSELAGLTLGDISSWNMHTFYTVEVT